MLTNPFGRALKRTPASPPAALAAAELAVVAVLTVGLLVTSLPLLLQPALWLGSAGVGTQAVLAGAVIYLLVHLVVMARFGGSVALVVHHVALIVILCYAVGTGRGHGYAALALVGTSTSMLRTLAVLQRYGHVRVNRRAAAVCYAVFEMLPIIAVCMHFSVSALWFGGLNGAELVLGAVCVPILAFIGTKSVVRALRNAWRPAGLVTGPLQGEELRIVKDVLSE